MKTLYTKKQMVEFGNYLLSEERLDTVVTKGMADLEKSIDNVTEEDIKNFNDKYKTEIYEDKETGEKIVIVKDLNKDVVDEDIKSFFEMLEQIRTL